MTAGWRLVWIESCLELGAAGADVGVALAWLFAKIGVDCGNFLGGLHRSRTSWGTYQDGLCADGQWHCNAHTNNFVVRNALDGPLMGYVDLDMAFSECDRAGCITPPTARADLIDPDHTRDDFNRLLERESINFFEVLGGGDASSGVPQVALRAIEEQPAAVRAAKHALYDTMVLACRETYGKITEQNTSIAPDVTDRDAFVDSPVPAVRQAALALVKMALVVTAELVA